MAGLRRTVFGAATLLGAPRGYFIPYRYAGAAAPATNEVVARLFRAAEERFLDTLAAMEDVAPDLLRIGGDAAPAPRWTQDWFPRLDAAAAYAMVRRHRPGRIVEAGSGHSTRFLARAVADGRLSTAITAIDPKPRAALPPGVRHEARRAEQAAECFAGLGAGDILFIDSSHVLMPGTDVDFLLGQVLPGLPQGVLVHVHDILLPDPYPPDWGWRGYNEQAAVAALLGTGAYEPLFASYYFLTRLVDWFGESAAARLPLVAGAKETSLWLRKVAPPVA